MPEKSAVIRDVVHRAWRRRRLLIVPVLLLLPLSCAAAYLVPRSYVARALILIQETPPDNLLARSNYLPRPAEKIQDRVGGLRALLTSDRVLTRVAESELSSSVDPRKRRGRIQELQQSLGLDLLGSELLRFTLTGSAQDGLGSKLQMVIDSFLDAYRTTGAQKVPERIEVVDPPKDPEGATRSRLVIVAAGLAAGAVLGLAMATVAEFLDTKVRHRDELQHLTSLPLLAVVSPEPLGFLSAPTRRSSPVLVRPTPPWRPRSTMAATSLLLAFLLFVPEAQMREMLFSGQSQTFVVIETGLRSVGRLIEWLRQS